MFVMGVTVLFWVPSRRYSFPDPPLPIIGRAEAGAPASVPSLGSVLMSHQAAQASTFTFLYW
jgi:hypothetical protein